MGISHFCNFDSPLVTLLATEQKTVYWRFPKAGYGLGAFRLAVRVRDTRPAARLPCVSCGSRRRRADVAPSLRRCGRWPRSRPPSCGHPRSPLLKILRATLGTAAPVAAKHRGLFCRVCRVRTYILCQKSVVGFARVQAFMYSANAESSV